MAELTTFARPYARAAFEYARDAKCLAQWADALSLTATICLDPMVIKALAAPSLTAEGKKAVLVELCGDSVDEKFMNFVDVLASNKRLALLSEVAVLFVAYKSEYEKAVDVTLTTAYPLTGDIEARLAAALKEKLEREVSLSTEIDESLIGGAVVRAGDTVIDGSLKGRLTKLADVMA